jgi:hypothetical protein
MSFSNSTDQAAAARICRSRRPDEKRNGCAAEQICRPWLAVVRGCACGRRDDRDGQGNRCAARVPAGRANGTDVPRNKYAAPPWRPALPACPAAIATRGKGSKGTDMPRNKSAAPGGARPPTSRRRVQKGTDAPRNKSAALRRRRTGASAAEQMCRTHGRRAPPPRVGIPARSGLGWASTSFPPIGGSPR